MHAMSVFKLISNDMGNQNHTADSIVKAGNADIEDKLQLLADVFGLDAASFMGQYFDVQEIAQATRRSNLIIDQEAWRMTIERCKRSRYSFVHLVVSN